jgi:excisionase family DNA binding protein
MMKRKRKISLPLEEKDNQVSITEAAKISKVTRQAIYVAIKQNKLSAKKDDKHWSIKIADLEAYHETKYCRSKSRHNGELIFDNSRGCYSVNQVANLLNVPAQKIYYALRTEMLKSTRKGAAWVIHMSDIKSYKEAHLGKNS